MTASPTTTRSPDHKRLRNEGALQEVPFEDHEMMPAGKNRSPKLSPAARAAAMPAHDDRTTRLASQPGARRQALTSTEPQPRGGCQGCHGTLPRPSGLPHSRGGAEPAPESAGLGLQDPDGARPLEAVAGLGQGLASGPQKLATRSASSRSWTPFSTRRQSRSSLTKSSTAQPGSTSSRLTSSSTFALPSTRS